MFEAWGGHQIAQGARDETNVGKRESNLARAAVSDLLAFPAGNPD
jgi:hypothetical protein